MLDSHSADIAPSFSYPHPSAYIPQNNPAPIADRMPAISGFVKTAFSDINQIWVNSLKPCLEAIGSFIKNDKRRTKRTRRKKFR